MERRRDPQLQARPPCERPRVGTSGTGDSTVVVAGRRKDQLDRITDEHPSLDVLRLDVTDPASIAEAAAALVRTHPDLNILINNAGVMLPESLKDPRLTVSENTIRTNLLGPLRMTQALLPHLLGRGDAAIVNVSSGLAFVPLPITPTWNATKAAIHSFSESLRIQLADTSVQVIELVPPAVRTTLMGQQDDGRAMPLEEFLSAVVSLLHSEPDAKEIIVDQVKFLRYAVATGSYDRVLTLLSSF
ncbi:SDR family oxidoreductase [Streptacidiphilus sp. EB103A]|uniref:SDR family oxidoreductase n=1 Tax=Streptacidiphilus sp. EB103A TaxID=3156275 RepID=UPI003515ECC2